MKILFASPHAYKELLLAIFFICVQARAEDVTVLPTSPTMLDTVRVFVPRGVIGNVGDPNFNDYSPLDTRVTMVSNRITVSLLLDYSGIPSTSSALELPLGQFPAGSYEVEVIRRKPDGSSAGTVGQASFSVSPRAANAPLWNHTDMWWDPSESGWGLGVTHHGSGNIFAVWYVYAEDRGPMWYVVPGGTWTTPVDFRGTAYRTSGPPFVPCNAPIFQTCFDASSVTVTPAGTVHLTFHPRTSEILGAEFNIDGRTTVRNLQRQPF